MILNSLDAQTLQARSPGRPLPGEEFVETDAVAGACFSGLLAVDARPLLAGAVAALIADIPAAAVLVPFGSLDALGKAAGISTVLAGFAYGGTMLLGGVLYGWLFQRAANDPRGGWLFGLAFGFVLWMVGPIPLLQWLPDRPI